MSNHTPLEKSFCKDLINHKLFDDAVKLVRDTYKLEVEASQSENKFSIKANGMLLFDLTVKLLKSWFERKKKKKVDSIDEKIKDMKENPFLDIENAHVIWIFFDELASKLSSSTYKKDIDELKFVSSSVNFKYDQEKRRLSIWCSFGDFETMRSKVESLKNLVTTGPLGQPSDKSKKLYSNDTNPSKGQSLSGKSEKNRDPKTGDSKHKGSEDIKKGELTTINDLHSSLCNLKCPDKSEISYDKTKDSKPSPSSQLEIGSEEKNMPLHSDKSKKSYSKDKSKIDPSTSGSKGLQNSKKEELTASDEDGTSNFNLTAPGNTNLSQSETSHSKTKDSKTSTSSQLEGASGGNDLTLHSRESENRSSQDQHELPSEDERAAKNKWLLFCTSSGKTKVFVYEASIVSLPGIDAIVNAANKHLSHAGGVAYHISKAAGGHKSKLEKECQSYIKTNGNLAVTKNFTSSAGDMPYKQVIHAVGPMWSDYKVKKECAKDLYTTIINVLEEADKRKLSKIAIPAISSGIFGVPKRVCAEMYIKGVTDYDHRNPQTQVKEIHFVDIDKDVLQGIRDAYGKWQQDDESLDFSNYSSDSGRNESSGQILSTSQYQRDSLEIPTSFQLSKNTSVKVYKHSIIDVRGVDAIACAVNPDFSIHKRKVAYLIKKQAGEKYEMEFQKMVSMISSKSRKDVLVCGAGKLAETKRIKYVIHIKLGRIDTIEDIYKIRHLYIQVFESAREKKMLKIALPLIGAANLKDASDADIQLCSRLFVKTLKEVVKERGENMSVEEVHLVDLEEKIINGVVKAFQEQDASNDEMSDQKGDLFGKSLSDETPVGKHGKGSYAIGPGDGKIGLITVKEINPERTVRNGQTSQAEETCSYKCGRPGIKKYPDCSHTLCHLCFTQPLESGCPFCIKDKKKKMNQTMKEKASKGGSNTGSMETDKCPICMDVLTNPRQLSCGHVFHSDCILQSQKNQPRCPICEKEMKKTTKETASKEGCIIQTEEMELCPICMDILTKPKCLPCGHNFHADCIKQSLEYKPACPICGTVMGQLIGNQPEGKMSDREQSGSLQGYEDCNTIEILYDIPDGYQTENHPHPGRQYKGTRRKAFLPNNSEGKKVLELLKIAFNRKLIFTIGESRTTGKTDIVTWNDIHHKTRIDGGPTNFGYPDKTYLSRVQEELAAKGVTEKDIKPDDIGCTIS